MGEGGGGKQTFFLVSRGHGDLHKITRQNREPVITTKMCANLTGCFLIE